MGVFVCFFQFVEYNIGQETQMGGVDDMRIAVVGDIQYRKGEDITEIAQDISALEPDTVIIVGDYGY